MSAQSGGGSSERAHLEHIAKQRGVDAPELDGPQAPDLFAYLLEYYGELRNSVACSESYTAVSFQDIKSWCDLRKTHLRQFELSALRQLDVMYFNHYMEARKNV